MPADRLAALLRSGDIHQHRFELSEQELGILTEYISTEIR